MMNQATKLCIFSGLAVLTGAVAASSTRADDPTVVCYTDAPTDGEAFSAICSGSNEDGIAIYAHVSAEPSGTVAVEVSDHHDCGSGRTVSCEVALSPWDLHYYTEDKTSTEGLPFNYIAITCACYDEDNLPASGFVD
jgi:hypothetical protein